MLISLPQLLYLYYAELLFLVGFPSVRLIHLVAAHVRHSLLEYCSGKKSEGEPKINVRSSSACT